jgi:putative photosynthetic complex assembly protein 2
MNILFPVSVVAGATACVLLALAALAPDATRHEAVGFTLLATLVALGLLEHLFMVLPVSADALWRWGLASRPAPKTGGRPEPSTLA